MISPFLDFWAIVNLLGVVQGLMLAIIFLTTRQGNRRSNRLLALFLLCGVFTTGEIFACYTGFIAWFPAIINSTECFDFFMGPLLYWYTLSLLKPDFSWKNQWVHLLPAVIFLIFRSPYFFQNSEFKLQDVHYVYHRIDKMTVACEPILWFPKYHFGGIWLDLWAHPLILAYSGYCLYLIYQFTHTHGQSFWKPSHPALQRVIQIVLFIAVIQVVVAAISFVSTDDLGDIYIAAVASLGYYVVSFWVIRDSQNLSVKSLVPEAEKKKYEKSSLDNEQIPQLVQRITRYMTEQKPYLNGSLTLSELADALKLSTHHLSQILNEQLGKNFADFVNEYRVDELKQKLQDASLNHLKIEELAFDSGFNSKSVFNTAFKKSTGLTPSQFRKQVGETSKVS